MNRLLFANRTAIVTGAGGGLGKSYALELGRRGCNVVVNDLGGSVSGQAHGNINVSQTNTGSKVSISDSVHEVVAEIRAAGGKAIGDGNNVLDAKSIIDNAVKEFGTVDVLVNNAGILRDRSFHKMTEGDFQAVIDVHLLGTFRMCHNAWPLMQTQNYGRIVNVSSGAATYGNFGQANYAAAKLGILGMGNVLAKEGAKFNINVNTLVPVAASRMTENLLSEELLNQMDPEHVTPIVSYLAHESNPHSGKVYEVGGGWYSEIRWQRSEGVLLGGKAAGEEIDTIATAEDIAQNMSAIMTFGAGAEYPTSPTDAISTFGALLAKGRGFPSTTPVQTTPTASPAPAPSGVRIDVFDGRRSTEMFCALNNALLKDVSM